MTTEWTFEITKQNTSAALAVPRLACDVDRDLNNRLKGGEKLPITVNATLPQDTEGEMKQVKTWASCDDGVTWNPVGLNAGQGPGRVGRD